MKNTYLFYIVTFQVLKVLLMKICKIQPPDIFVFISRYHFSKIFRTSFNNIWKKYFRHECPFFNGFAQTLHPLNDKSGKRGKSFLLMLPKGKYGSDCIVL